ncbi:MAG: hypothetical protein ACJ764_05355 [Solirubrobacteraceae bacterium]
MAKWSLLGAGLGRAIAFFALWMLLVDGKDVPNLVTGAVCALIAAGLSTLLQTLGAPRARPRLSMFRYIYRPLLLLVTDTGRVIAALVRRLVLRRPISGEFRAVRYRAAGDDPESLARRVMTEWGSSLAANRYAIGVDQSRNVLIVHELVPARGPLDPLELG